MQKKTIGLITGLLLNTVASSIALAGSSDCPFNGFYGGLSLGGGLTTNKGNSAFNGSFSFPDDFPPTIIGISNSRDYTQSKNSLDASLFVGYSFTCDLFYLGAEAFINRTNHKGHNSEFLASPQIFPPDVNFVNASIDISSKIKPFGIGIDVRPGVLLTENSLLFARVGISRNRISIQSDVTISNFNAPPAETLSHSLSTRGNKNVNSYRIGGGLEQYLCSNFSVKIDYIYSYFRKINISGVASRDVTSPFFEVIGTANLSTQSQAKLSHHSVLLGLSYYW